MYVCRYNKSTGIISRIISTDAIYSALIEQEHIIDGKGVGIISKIPKSATNMSPLAMVDKRMLRVVSVNGNGTLEVELAETG